MLLVFIYLEMEVKNYVSLEKISRQNKKQIERSQ